MAEKEISFTRTVKEEITSLEIVNDEYKKALLSGFIKINSNLVLRNGTWNISAKSENIKTAKLIITLLESIYKIKCGVKITEQKRFKTNNHDKIVNFEINQNGKEIIEDLELYSEEYGFNTFPSSLVKDDEAKKYFLAGCFLASGSVNSPSSPNYHLEVTTDSELFAKYLCNLLKKFYLEAKYIQRRNLYAVYLKKSESISDFLRILKASQSLLFFEDVRIQRDTINSINRINNCEISNELKAQEVGRNQADSIRWYKDTFGFAQLNNKLKVIAEVRLASPEATYNELVDDCLELHGFNISKPGLAYRMNKLLEIIEEARKG